MPEAQDREVAGLWRDEPASSGAPIIGEVAAEYSATELERARFTDEVAPQRDEVLRLHGSGDLRLYERLLRDDQVQSTFQQRRTAVIANPWQVDAGGDAPIDEEAADDLREQLNQVSFDRITMKMLAGLMYGYGVGELMYRIERTRVVLDDILVRKARRFRFGIDRGLIMVDPEQRRMPERKFWVYRCGADDDDNPYGQGLGHWLYWPVWFKRNAEKFWSLWLEKNAAPTPVAKGPPGMTRAQEDELLDILAAITQGGRVVIPKNIELALLEAARESGVSYDTFVDHWNAAISKVVLSQTMTTDDGSSLAQAKVHGKVALKVIGTDSDLITESFSKGPGRWLTEWNYPGAKPPIVYRLYEEPEDLEARAKRDEVVTRMGYRPTPEYIAETYGDGFVPAVTSAAPSSAAPDPEAGSTAVETPEGA